MISNCCKAEIIEETDVCSECMEHAEAVVDWNVPFEEQIILIEQGKYDESK
jgi:hypothetical protein